MAGDARSTRHIYDEQANRWSRSDRVLLSDFTARPHVIRTLQPLKDARVLDLGCGEGYVSRLAHGAGAASVLGLDVSGEMVEIARRSAGDEGALRYERWDANEDTLPAGPFDRIIAVFLFNYLTLDQMEQVLREVRSRLAPGGRFVFTVPHPCLAYMKPLEPPFFFDPAGFDYFDGLNATYEGRIWRRDGQNVSVRCVHKRFADYFAALSRAGWTNCPAVEELSVSDAHLALDPEFFTPLKGYPLHVMFTLESEA